MSIRVASLGGRGVGEETIEFLDFVAVDLNGRVGGFEPEGVEDVEEAGGVLGFDRGGGASWFRCWLSGIDGGGNVRSEEDAEVDLAEAARDVPSVAARSRGNAGELRFSLEFNFSVPGILAAERGGEVVRAALGVAGAQSQSAQGEIENALSKLTESLGS